MDITKLYSCIFLVTFLLFSRTTWAACNDVVIEEITPLDFGKLRIMPHISSGLVTLWPTGDFNLSEGLSLSKNSKPLPGKVKITAPYGAKLELVASLNQFGSSSEPTSLALENPNFFSYQAVVLFDDYRLVVFMPEKSSKPKEHNMAEIFLTVTANLFIARRIDRGVSLKQHITMRCTLSD